jgi:hypothetical protein
MSAFSAAWSIEIFQLAWQFDGFGSQSIIWILSSGVWRDNQVWVDVGVWVDG